ncbi:MAG: elongation factor P maturation arginine rhamnosyltransferase EarP [Azoarcus sp.]|jgi:uncharacterized repeat protein (TIGR03837 family)|nr:elongation factor P maturation arginine rhamnosyltransferase EarP [Azoarcus sp.]
MMRAFVPDVMTKWEIFCRVVDNYGDTGTCWRLARALAVRYGVDVRLWVDDWAALAKVCPEAVRDGIGVAGVELREWMEPFPLAEPADVVIEAFACELPVAHVRAMAARTPPPLWINLEYLSAEDWVRGCNGLPSPQADPALTKYFFFPGFVEGTGGLIRETGLLARRDRALLECPCADWLRARGVTPPRADALLVSLFSYEQPGIGGLLRRWQAGGKPVLLLIPEGKVLPGVEAALGAALPPGARLERGALRVAVLPFMGQDDYDGLLWRCDLNLVRGEDSFVRAQWAGRPLAWHIYPQEDGAHLVKLEAFLALYRTGLGAAAAAALAGFWRAWNGGTETEAAAAWPAFARALPEIGRHARAWCAILGARPDLVDELWRFCQHLRKKSG